MNPEASRPDLSRIGGRALVEVLGTLLSLPATEVRGANQPPARGIGRHVLATVTLNGERVSGAVRLQIPEAFAEQAAGTLLGGTGAAPLGAIEVNDFTGELGNMVAGRVAALLREQGFPCQLGTPEVLHGADARSAPEPGADHGRTDWLCEGHLLTLEIQCRYQPT